MGASGSIAADELELDFRAIDAADIAVADDAASVRPSLLLGITLAGAREFAVQHWDGELCDPPCVLGERFPADEAARVALVERLHTAGRTNEWAGDCPVLRVLEADSWRDAASDDEGLLADAVRRDMNGYANQAAILHACPGGRSWCEVLQARGSAHVGMANVFVSWALGQRVEALLGALQRWLEESKRDPASTYFWVCDFSIRQTGDDTKADVGRLGDMVRAIGLTVLFLDPWDAPAPLQRAWCLWEIFHSVSGDGVLDVVMSPEQQVRFAAALKDDYHSIQTSMSKIDVKMAETRKAADKQMIMDAVASLKRGAQGLDEVVKERMRVWLVGVSCTALEAVPAAERATSGLINNVGRLLYDNNKYDEAQLLFEEALVGRREKLGNSHKDTLGAMDNLGRLYQAQGKLDEALVLFDEALTGSRAVLGDTHADTLGAISNKAGLLREQGKLPMAKTLYEEVLAGRRATLGNSHTDTLTAVNNLALLLQNQGKLGEALPLQKEALAGYRETLGETHPYTLSAISNFAQVLYMQGNLDPALLMMEEAVGGFRANLGEDHPETQNAMAGVAMLRDCLGK
jgi:hypothetical protein